MVFKHPFYFLRHGETEWNRTRRTQGQLDSQLNEIGREQARHAAERLRAAPLERIVSSPLSRARHTAQAVAAHHDIEILLDHDLMECHLGDHQGEPHGPWLARYWRGEYDPPNGEPYSDFCTRVWSAMARAVACGPNTLIVAHGGLWKAASEYVVMEPNLIPLPNAVPLHVSPGEGAWSQRLVGE